MTTPSWSRLIAIAAAALAVLAMATPGTSSAATGHASVAHPVAGTWRIPKGGSDNTEKQATWGVTKGGDEIKAFAFTRPTAVPSLDSRFLAR